MIRSAIASLLSCLIFVLPLLAQPEHNLAETRLFAQEESSRKNNDLRSSGSAMRADISRSASGGSSQKRGAQPQASLSKINVIFSKNFPEETAKKVCGVIEKTVKEVALFDTLLFSRISCNQRSKGNTVNYYIRFAIKKDKAKILYYISNRSVRKKLFSYVFNIDENFDKYIYNDELIRLIVELILKKAPYYFTASLDNSIVKILKRKNIKIIPVNLKIKSRPKIRFKVTRVLKLNEALNNPVYLVNRNRKKSLNTIFKIKLKATLNSLRHFYRNTPPNEKVVVQTVREEDEVIQPIQNTSSSSYWQTDSPGKPKESLSINNISLFPFLGLFQAPLLLSFSSSKYTIGSNLEEVGQVGLTLRSYSVHTGVGNTMNLLGFFLRFNILTGYSYLNTQPSVETVYIDSIRSHEFIPLSLYVDVKTHFLGRTKIGAALFTEDLLNYVSKYNNNTLSGYINYDLLRWDDNARLSIGVLAQKNFKSYNYEKVLSQGIVKIPLSNDLVEVGGVVAFSF